MYRSLDFQLIKTKFMIYLFQVQGFLGLKKLNITPHMAKCIPDLAPPKIIKNYGSKWSRPQDFMEKKPES